jgi:hypothetical protein
MTYENDASPVTAITGPARHDVVPERNGRKINSKSDKLQARREVRQ